MVGETGLEPARVLPHNDLNVARIPIPPPAHERYDYSKYTGSANPLRIQP